MLHLAADFFRPGRRRITREKLQTHRVKVAASGALVSSPVSVEAGAEIFCNGWHMPKLIVDGAPEYARGVLQVVRELNLLRLRIFAGRLSVLPIHCVA